MAVVGYVVGFVDFSSPWPISQVAELLSSRVFGAIAFVEKEVDGEHDLGTLCLAHDFLGLQADLFGESGRYTLEIGTLPSASVSSIGEVCDFSAMLKHRIKSLEISELELL